MKKLSRILASLGVAFCANTFAMDDAVCAQVRRDLREGDLIFLEIENPVFQRVARVSGGWTSHVGVAIWDSNFRELVVAHSTIPRVTIWNLCKFLRHGKDSHFAVTRLKVFKDESERSPRFKLPVRIPLVSMIQDLLGTFYHLGFKLESKRQFCSKFVWQLYQDTLNVDIGRVETVEELVRKNLAGHEFEKSDRKFWRWWFMGRIPWKRKTITPESIYNDPRFYEVIYHPPLGNWRLARRVAQPTENYESKWKNRELLY